MDSFLFSFFYSSFPSDQNTKSSSSSNNDNNNETFVSGRMKFIVATLGLGLCLSGEVAAAAAAGRTKFTVAKEVASSRSTASADLLQLDPII